MVCIMASWRLQFIKIKVSLSFNVPVIIRFGLNMNFVHFVIHCTTTMACVHALAGQAFIYSVLIPLPLYPSLLHVVLGYLKSLSRRQ